MVSWFNQGFFFAKNCVWRFCFLLIVIT
jgi:hypothetical protein